MLELRRCLRNDAEKSNVFGRDGGYETMFSKAVGRVKYLVGDAPASQTNMEGAALHGPDT